MAELIFEIGASLPDLLVIAGLDPAIHDPQARRPARAIQSDVVARSLDARQATRSRAGSAARPRARTTSRTRCGRFSV